MIHQKYTHKVYLYFYSGLKMKDTLLNKQGLEKGIFWTKYANCEALNLLITVYKSPRYKKIACNVKTTKHLAS